MNELFLVIVLYAAPTMPLDNIYVQQLRCETEVEMAQCNKAYNELGQMVNKYNLGEDDFWIYFDELDEGAIPFVYMKKGYEVIDTREQ